MSFSNTLCRANHRLNWSISQHLKRLEPLFLLSIQFLVQIGYPHSISPFYFKLNSSMPKLGQQLDFEYYFVYCWLRKLTLDNLKQSNGQLLVRFHHKMVIDVLYPIHNTLPKLQHWVESSTYFGPTPSHSTPSWLGAPLSHPLWLAASVWPVLVTGVLKNICCSFTFHYKSNTPMDQFSVWPEKFGFFTKKQCHLSTKQVSLQSIWTFCERLRSVEASIFFHYTQTNNNENKNK